MGNLVDKIINKYNRTFLDVLFRIGFKGEITSKKGAAILCYHGVDLFGNKKYNMRFISKKSFEKQLIFFKKHFNVISVDDYHQQKFMLNKFNIAITFDDGYKNNYKFVYPLLIKYGIPASIFITGLNNTPYNFLWADMLDIFYIHSDKNKLEFSGIEFEKSNFEYISEHGTSLKKLIKYNGGFAFKQLVIEELFSEFTHIINNNPIDDYWELMTDKEIQEISTSKLISIGSHGYYHNNLANIDLKEALEEVILSKKYLENLVQKPISEIAYPDGSYSRELVTEIDKIGIKKQLVLEYLHTEDQIDNDVICRHGVYPVYTTSFQLSEIPDLK
jgi:peptidoglycan/xylan/chitin deacetylase (PgdA/CDA1 family)